MRTGRESRHAEHQREQAAVQERGPGSLLREALGGEVSDAAGDQRADEQVRDPQRGDRQQQFREEQRREPAEAAAEGHVEEDDDAALVRLASEAAFVCPAAEAEIDERAGENLQAELKEDLNRDDENFFHGRFPLVGRAEALRDPTFPNVGSRRKASSVRPTNQVKNNHEIVT